MAFYLRTAETVEEGVKRIVSEQIGSAIRELDDQHLDRHEAVHQARKRCKRIRGVIRLVRPRFPETYRRENAWFRDAAKALSRLRDAEAIVKTVDALRITFQDQVAKALFTSARKTLTERRRRLAEDEAGLAERLDDFRQRMCEAGGRVSGWTLGAEEFDAIEPGLLKTYRRGRKAMAVALDDPRPENLHEWRKRAKYHRYHNRLLQEIWKPVIGRVRNEVVVLSDCLGDDHDLSVLGRTLEDSPDEFGGQRDVQVLLGLIDRRSVELRAQAESLGKRVYAEKPEPFGSRYRTYWEAWRQETKSSSASLRLAPGVVAG